MSGGIAVLGLGHYAPERRVPNADIEARFGLEPGWIVRRTGIEARRYAAPSEALSDMAVKAGDAALSKARIARSDVALLLLATSTPDHLLPPTAPLVAQRLAIEKAGGIDIAGACAGFVYALTLGAAFATLHRAPVLIVAANILSRRINWDDRNTSILFSDAAGAMVIAPSTSERSCILGSHLATDGSAYGMIQIPGGGSRRPLSNLGQLGETLMVIDDGKAVFARAVNMMTACADEALKRAGLAATDVDHFVPHQANSRMMDAVADKLSIPRDKMRSTIGEFANSSAATIPLTLSLYAEQNGFRKGDVILMTAAGAGLTAGSVVLRW